jgi:hemolysin activation/secretion protein
MEEDLRGYRLGAFQDERLLAAQVEYRLELFWRFSVVGFVGVGQVAARFDEFKKSNWLPGAGFGFRILVAKENHVNLRVDFAWGREGNTATYVNGAEAF